MGEIFHSYENSVRDRSGVLTGTTRGFPLRFLRASYYFDNGKKSWSQGDRRGLWFDYNSDGLLDLLVNNSGFPPDSRLVLFEQQSDHELVDRAEVLRVNILNPSGSIMFDFNRDGYPDIITGQRTTRRPDIKTRLYAFANHSTPKGKAFRFYLRGKKSNVHAYGGTLFLKSSKKRYLRVVEDFYGSLPSQNEEGVFFTLPFGERLESVEVRWPILKKSSSGRFYPLSKTYKLKMAKHKNYQPFTLCENGRWYRGRRKSCP